MRSESDALMKSQARESAERIAVAPGTTVDETCGIRPASGYQIVSEVNDE